MIKIKVFNQGLYFANSYLIYDDVSLECAVIDPAVPYSIFANDSFLSNTKLKYILLTHCHYDHLLCYEDWKSKTAGQTAIGIYDNIGLALGSINLSGIFTGENHSYPSADILLNDGDILHLGKEKIHVISTPGHTIGSVCYQIENAIFTGDTLFYDGDIGRTDFPSGDHVQLNLSLEKLLSIPNNLIVYPGHGRETTLHNERSYHIENI